MYVKLLYDIFSSPVVIKISHLCSKCEEPQQRRKLPTIRNSHFNRGYGVIEGGIYVIKSLKSKELESMSKM